MVEVKIDMVQEEFALIKFIVMLHFLVVYICVGWNDVLYFNQFTKKK